MEKTRWNEIWPNFSQFAELQILGIISCNKHIAMYSSIKFQSGWKNPDYGPNLPKKHEWQKFWKNKH